MLKLGWFSTGRGPGSRNLLKAVMDEKEKNGLDVEISFVFCNWDNTEEPNPRREQREMFFDMVKGYGIPLITKSWKTFRPDLWDTDEKEWRDEYGKELRRLTRDYDIDLGILAGYMLWMDDETCMEYDMLNLHPALPDGPKGTWQEVIWQLIREGADRQGAMLHLCTPEWDRGAPLTYCGFSLRGEGYDNLWDDLYKKLEDSTLEDIAKSEGVEEPLFKKIRADGAKRELPLIVETIRSFADGRVRIENKQLVANGKKLDTAFDLSAEVDRSIGE
jgi:phosphoribosylglycinamide formyltransferase-1